MFTQGLDNNALNWVKQKEGLFSGSNQGPRINPIIEARNGSNGYGLPHSSKFGSGHFPASSNSITRTTTGNSIDSDSDNEDTESEDVYGGLYSLDSSPQEERLPNGKAYGYGNPLQRHKRYASDYTNSDVSSSKETVAMRERFARGNGRQRGRQNGYKKDELSDSDPSSEFSTLQVGGSHHVKSKAGSNVYFSSAPSKLRAESVTEKDDEIPSAPPFHVSAKEADNGTRRTSRHSEPFVENSQHFTSTDATSTLQNRSGFNTYPDDGKKMQQPFVRTSVASEGAPSSSQLPRIPEFHASALGPWHAVIAYDACVRLCLNAWARGCKEAPVFLENECCLLRDAFSLQQVLLQSEEELLAKRTTTLTKEGAVPKPRKTLGKMKVQVRRVKSMMDPPTGCNIMAVRSSLHLRTPSMNMESVRNRFSTLPSTLSSRWHALQKSHFRPRVHSNSSFSRQSMAYIHGSTRYLKKVPGRLKTGITSLRHSSSSIDAIATQETYSCLLRMKSSTEEDAIRMQPGSGEEHIFLPETVGDDLIIEVLDSKGKHFGRALIQVATVAEDPTDKVRWCSLYREPEHELIGKVQVHINYSTRFDDSNQQKYGIVAETVAYDLVLEVAMKVQNFQQRNLLLHGSWKWLLTEFASYYGVSDVYTRLRYLSYIMDVATPTADCLVLVHDLLVPVLLKGDKRGTLSHQENRILGETRDQIKDILALAFENYKSLDESSLSGIMDVFRPPTGVAAPALEPAIRLYTLLNDILSPEVQTDLCHHFQVAAKKRSRRHLAETDEYVLSTIEGLLLDPDTISTAYQKMTSLCMNLKDEIFTDMEIHNLHILPSFVDLPSLSSAKYSIELCNRLRSFLISCPPSGPLPHVAELIIAATDFQRDLTSWKISPVKGGVDAKELFHLYILAWIQDKRNSLVEICKLDKVKWAGVKTQQSTTPFVDDMYERMRETLTDYEVVICRWPEYVFVLENAIADVENAVMEALEKQYMDVLLPLKDSLMPKKFGLKYVQKLAKRSVCPYAVPDELGILLNSMKRMLDILRPKIESQFKTWGSCMPNSGNTAPGERLSEVTVMLRTKFRNYLQAVAEKLAENTKLQVSTKLKKILQDSKGIVVESDVQGRMQPLVEQLTSTMTHLHSIFETHVFVSVCRHYWDRMGQDILSFLDNHKENRSWNKGSRIAVSILDDTFASQLQHLLGNMLQAKDLEPPRCIMEVRSILCKDGPDHKDSAFYY